jgi:spermidine synthase
VDQHQAFAESRQIFRGNSNFGQLQVLEAKDGRQRVYLNDFLVQNTYDPVDRVSLSMFTYMLHGLARYYTPGLTNVLCIGLGVGIVPMQFAHEGVNVEVAEINPAVVGVARDYFDLDPALLRIHITDGRQFLQTTARRYDAVILDAFLGDSSPSHLMTQEAFAAIRRVLATNGTLVINAFADFSPRRDYLAASLHKTLKAVFPSVRIHAAGNGNVFFVASPSELPMRPAPSVEGLPARVRDWVRVAYGTLRETDPAHGRVLTDDYNPVEFHDAANRERLHRMLAESMRTL